MPRQNQGRRVGRRRKRQRRAPSDVNVNADSDLDAAKEDSDFVEVESDRESDSDFVLNDEEAMGDTGEESGKEDIADGDSIPPHRRSPETAAQESPLPPLNQRQRGRLGRQVEPPPPQLKKRRRLQLKKQRGKRKQKEIDEEPSLLWEVWEAENEKWIDDFEKMDAEGETGSAETGLVETVDPSSEILIPLLRFQREWLAWALQQEASENCGGILADEMGMGKTIQAISLVLTARSLCRESISSAYNADVPSCSTSSASLPKTKCTLVVCPVVAVIQWVGEIDRFTEKGSTRVLVYHGAKRAKMTYNFDDYDFVITTYSTIECEFRKYKMPPKEKCLYCGKGFYPRKMAIHLRYYCGPNACRTEGQAKQVRRKKNNHVLQKDHSYSNPDKNKGLCQGESVLHTVKWERIILDEAHYIKDRHSNTAKATFALDSSYRWALSGTPLQNRVGELYSLVRFLQIHPFSFYFCKDCNCRVLEYGSSKHCTECAHSNSRHFCWWNKMISKPIQESSRSYFGRRAMILLKDRVLKSIVLRRTKEGRAADLALPPRIVHLRRDSLDKNEQEFYEALYTQSRTIFDTYADAGTLLNNYAHVFDLLTRLRQAVDHPYLVVYSATSGRDSNDTMNPLCGICHNPPEDLVVTSCHHIFCKFCLIEYSKAVGDVTCPTCSKPLTVDLTNNNSTQKLPATILKGCNSGILSRLKDLEAFRTSTKIEAVKEEIRNMVENDGSAKGIVFSQFTSFLDLIHFSLEKGGIKCIQLVGSMALTERDKAIRTFIEDPDCRIFLMSLKAGGVALNLTVASHVFMMDPWWNPAVERQAQDRIHRIGQYKPIRVTRFIIEGTIEDRILKLQEKKELVFQGTIENSGEAIAKLTEADLRFLFQG